MTSMTGVVLAGGASRRMGRDKALVVVEGVRLVDRALDVLDAVCAEVLVASGDGRRLAELGRREIADAVSGAGPLSGLVAALETAAHPLVAVVAVDLPAANAAVLARLAERWEGEPAVIPEVGGRLQPLHAVWARDVAPDLRAYLERGERGVIAAATAVGARSAGPDVWADLDPTGAFARNVNRPDDLRETDRP